MLCLKSWTWLCRKPGRRLSWPFFLLRPYLPFPPRWHWTFLFWPCILRNKLLLPLFSGLSFSFLSHKVIRWFCPFLLLLVFLANGFLFGTGLFYKITFFIQLFLFLIPLFDAVLRNMKVHLTLLRFISHFYLMNLALLIGFFRFTGGVKSNIWQPTQRFQ